MGTYELFVGSNNATHTVDVDPLQNILSAHVDGYTMTRTLGCWQGTREQSVSVLLTIPKGELPTLLAEIRERLAQDAVAWRKVPKIHIAA